MRIELGAGGGGEGKGLGIFSKLRNNYAGTKSSFPQKEHENNGKKTKLQIHLDNSYRKYFKRVCLRRTE